MTDTTAVVNPATTNAVPEALIDYAIDAIRRGYEDVALTHSTESDLETPTGWLLWLTSAPASILQPGVTQLMTYRLGDDLDEQLSRVRLHDVTRPEPVDEMLLDLFAIGVRNGWAMSYERDLIEGASARMIDLGTRHRLKGYAIDWDDPAHNECDVRISRRVDGNTLDATAFVDHVRTNLIAATRVLRTPAPRRRPTTRPASHGEG